VFVSNHSFQNRKSIIQALDRSRSDSGCQQLRFGGEGAGGGDGGGARAVCSGGLVLTVTATPRVDIRVWSLRNFLSVTIEEGGRPATGGGAMGWQAGSMGWRCGGQRRRARWRVRSRRRWTSVRKKMNEIAQ
jgi:hypothetical protein